jgi:hypothetical protein
MEANEKASHLNVRTIYIYAGGTSNGNIAV